MKSDRILKEQVTMLQKALEARKQEWENMKASQQTMKESMAANKEMIISKATQVDTQIPQRVVISEKKAKYIKRTNIPKEIKPKGEDTNGQIRMEEKKDVNAIKTKEREHKDKKDTEKVYYKRNK